MPNSAQQLARRGRSLAKKAAGTGLSFARAGAERVIERAFGEGAAKHRDRQPGHAAPPQQPRAPASPAAGGSPSPTAAEAVQAEQAAARAWRPADTAASPPDASLEHVTEEATLAGESADAGAEEGAGPEVAVAPPWPGYHRMRARDVVDRLGGADADLAAAVRLYEASTKNRKTVLQAAARVTRTRARGQGTDS